MTDEENLELVKLIKSDINVSKNMELLYEGNLPFIKKVILRYTTFIEKDDLLQEAYLALVKTVQEFDMDSEFSFVSDLALRIRNDLVHYICNSHRHIRVTHHVNSLERKYKNYIETFRNQNGEYPQDEEIATFLQISQKQLQNLRIYIFQSHQNSTNTPSYDDESTLEDTISDNYKLEEAVIEKLDFNWVKKILWDAVNELDDNSRIIISKHYKNNVQLKDIAKFLCKTPQSISVLEVAALSKLRKNKSVQELADYYDLDIADKDFTNLYKGGFKNFKNTGMSSVEFYVIEKEKLENRISKVDELLANLKGVI